MLSRRVSFLLHIIFAVAVSTVSFLYNPVVAQTPSEAQYKEDYSKDGNVNISDVIVTSRRI